MDEHDKELWDRAFASGKLEGISHEAMRVRKVLMDMTYGTADWSPTIDQAETAQEIADALGMALR